MFLKLDIRSNFVSGKQTTRTREKSDFVKEVLAGLAEGGYIYVSHKKWLSQAGEQTKASAKNGPRYTLKRYGVDCKAIVLTDAEEREQVAEADGVELSENEIIYSMKQGEDFGK